MGSSSRPEPYAFIGKRAKDLLTKDYNFDKKFTLSIPHSAGLSLTVSGLKRDQIFIGDASTIYKSGETTVDVKVDTYSNVCTKVSMDNILSNTKIAFSFKMPDHKSGKMDVEYRHQHAVINSSIGLNPSPLLEFQAAIGTKDLCLGAELGFDTASASFTKYNAGISFNKPDFSAAVMLVEKGKALKGSYVHSVTPFSGTTIAAEMAHRFSSRHNSFTLGSSHSIDPNNVVKARLSDSGKIAVQWLREWRPKSLVTFSAEYDTKAMHPSSKFGLALALKP